MSKQKGPILDRVAYGWGHLEPSIVGWLVAKLPFVAKGIHGNSKTTVAKVIAQAISNAKDGEDTGVRYVPCDKASILSIAGLPDKDAMLKSGELAFMKSRSTLIGEGPKFAVLDELTRSPKETQNFLLEFVDGNTVFGIKSSCEGIMATMNPESYKGTIKLDAALVDRFAGTLPIDDFADIDGAGVGSMIAINMARLTNPNYDRECADELRERIGLVKTKYIELMANVETLARVRSYYEQFCSIAQSKLRGFNETILSGREMAALLWRSTLGIGAYYMVVNGWTEGQAMIRATEDTIKYCIVLKHNLSQEIAGKLNLIHVDAQFILSATAKGRGSEVMLAFAKSGTAAQKVEFWRAYIDDVIKNVPQQDATMMMESTIGKIENLVKDFKGTKQSEVSTLKIELYGIARPKVEFASIMDHIEGAMICELIQSLRGASVNPEREPFQSILLKAEIPAVEIVELNSVVNKDESLPKF